MPRGEQIPVAVAAHKPIDRIPINKVGVVRHTGSFAPDDESPVDPMIQTKVTEYNLTDITKGTKDALM